MNKLLLLTALASLSLASAAIPLPEHPRPDWERREWVNLNGEWNFAKDKDNKGVAEKWFTKDAVAFPLTINVPFPWGSPSSGIKEEGVNIAWYRRTLTVPKAWAGKRIFLVVGASDHTTDCYVENRLVGRNIGGYVPFEFELTNQMECGKPFPLTLRVQNGNKEKNLYGKQGYGDVKGIWQTIYLEARPETYLETVHFYPNIKEGSVTAVATLGAPAKNEVTFDVAFKKADPAEKVSVTFKPGEQKKSLKIGLKNVKLWDIENPYLYEVKARLTGKGVQDEVATYFGMREISVVRIPGINAPYIALNGKPIYLQMTLDQSYTPMGHYTFPSDEYMKNEIMISKRLALNGNRIHIKVEVPRKLYWADKLGLLIMADVPNAWGEPSPEWFAEHWDTFERMVARDFNHPSIFSWVLWNETWGLLNKPENMPEKDRNKPWFWPQTQRYVAKKFWEAKALDTTRLIEDNSPCHQDHVVTDINTWHGYHNWYTWEKMVADWCAKTFPGSKKNFVDGHVQGDTPMMNSECGNVWGYSGSTGDCDFTWDYHVMINAFRRHLKCAGWLYTEHHDVCNEWNGYVRFDRTWKETGIEELFPGMTLNDFHADAFIPLDKELFRKFNAKEIWNMPVDISLTTEKYAGKTLSLFYRTRAWNTKGKLIESAPSAAGTYVAKTWQNGSLATVPVTLPDEAAVGVVCFWLNDGDKTIARNFACFQTVAKQAENIVSVNPVLPESKAWSKKEWWAADGLKQNGAGEGHYTYAFEVPKNAKGGAVFRAELSAKRLNGKDQDGGKGGRDLDFMLGGGSWDRSKNPNSYPQTSVEKFPSKLKVYANGVLVHQTVLPDDPADHRGIISWSEQFKNRRLSEAGSYGYFVEVEIPAGIVAKSTDGKLRVRLEGDNGIAVYGARFGRYPIDPLVEFK